MKVISLVPYQFAAKVHFHEYPDRMTVQTEAGEREPAASTVVGRRVAEESVFSKSITSLPATKGEQTNRKT